MVRSFRLKIHGKLYKVEVGELTESPVSVTVNGESYEVELDGEAAAVKHSQPAVSQPAPRPFAPISVGPVQKPAAHASNGYGKVIAPMPGKVLAIKVEVGQVVAYGDELCVLEAMKMEQSIRAVIEGKVRGIRVAAGQTVAYGDVLVEFE